MPPSVPVARLGPIDARARTRLPNEIDMTIVDSGRKSRVAAAARTAGIASASSSPATTTPERAPVGGFAAHTVGEEHFYGHMLSGALAGTTEHCAMFPLDTIKTRMQTATTSAVAGATLGGSTVPSQSWIPRSGTTILSTINPVASIRAAASPPAKPPAVNCVKKLSSSTSFPPLVKSLSAIFELSYAVKWMAVNGTFIASVVGYDRYSARTPPAFRVRLTQSHTPLYGELCICSRCLTVSTGVCTASPTTVAHAPAKAW